ncbi:MAG: HIT family protein [Chloroflexi bacterium]|nr:HIT family protein [Chloroflexota bacterium]
MDCVFCAIRDGKIPALKLHDDERVMAFMDINPRTEGHCLVVPKAHAETVFDLEEADAAALMPVVVRVAKAVKAAFNPDGMNLVQANGKAAAQLVPHFHMHILPRWYTDGVVIDWHHQPGNLEHIKANWEKIRALLG